MRNYEEMLRMPSGVAKKDRTIIISTINNRQGRLLHQDNQKASSKIEPCCNFNILLLMIKALNDRANRFFYNHALLKVALLRRTLLATAFLSVVLALFYYKCNTTPVCARLDKELYYCAVQVQEGDTIWSIAEEHMTQEWRSTREYVNAIKKLNQKKSDFIYAGMYLSIPYYQ